MNRIQFSLRTLLLAMACFAVVFWIVRLLSVSPIPTIPLADALAEYNFEARGNAVGALEPPLTENEVVTAIKAKLPTLQGQPEIKTIYEKIADTRRIPACASIYFMDRWESSTNQIQFVWWINLNVVGEKDHGGYGLRIRETMNPAFVQNHIVP